MSLAQLQLQLVLFSFLFFHHGNTTCTSPRKLKFCMHTQFNSTSPEMEKKRTSQSPRIAVASYFATFGHILAISSWILMGKKTKLVYSISIIQLAIQLAISQSPRIAVASYFATFAHISAISSQILMGQKGKFVYSKNTIQSAIQVATSQSPIISVASYFATFGYISAIQLTTSLSQLNKNLTKVDPNSAPACLQIYFRA